MRFSNSRFLRCVLIADATTCFAIGLLMVFGFRFLAELLGLPDALLRYAGISLFPFAIFLVYLSSRVSLSTPAVWAVILLNALWTLDSFLLFVTGWVNPTQLGYAFVTAQAIGVAVFASLEYLGLKRSRIISSGVVTE
ncbi:MAG TPA: hypothetical protein VF074_20620 [Pyrinomonadaceae bacterium]